MNNPQPVNVPPTNDPQPTIYDILLMQVKESIKSKKINQSTIISIIVIAMQLINKNNSITGYEKKQLVLQVIKEVINTQDSLDQTDKMSLNILVDTVGSNMIDNLIAASKGKLNLKKNNKCCIIC